MSDDDKKKDEKPAKKKSSLSTLPENGDVIELTPEAVGLGQKALGLGVLGLAVALLLGGGLMGPQFQHSYLTAYMWALSISVGGVWWVTLQHLFGSRASVVMRRTGEIIAQGVMVMGLLALPLLIPVLAHNPALYPWVTHEGMHKFHIHGSKATYFSSTFFVGRVVLYFVIFALLSRFWIGKSIAQEKTKGDVAFYKKLQGNSAPAMIVFTLTVTFCAIDFLMTLDPLWFSTIFGVYYFATCVETFHCVLALTLMWLQSKGMLEKSVTREHYHDVGKMMFAFVSFWTYIAFSQFMLIWYANIPEETHWFKMRLEGSWFEATLWLGATHFVFPFFGMMSRSMKRHKGRLRFWAIYLLVVCWFDMYWLVAPNLHKEGMSINATDIAAWVGMAGMVVFSIVFFARRSKLVAIGDPRLARSLAFENI